MASTKSPVALTDPSDVLADLSSVRLRRRVQDGKRVFEAGTIGTIVFRYGAGVGYEVEIGEETAAVVTLLRNDIDPV